MPVSAHPTPENHGCWWLVTGRWERLHAVPAAAISPAQMRSALDDGDLLPRRAVCGTDGDWTMPGMFSRLGRARCAHCCRRLGIPAGNGTPANETGQT